MKPYGCHNKPRGDGYWARNGSVPVHADLGFSMPMVTEAQLLVWVPDTMSQACGYDLRATDARCEGCDRRC